MKFWNGIEYAQIIAKNEEKPCSTLLQTHFSDDSGYPKNPISGIRSVTHYLIVSTRYTYLNYYHNGGLRLWQLFVYAFGTDIGEWGTKWALWWWLVRWRQLRQSPIYTPPESSRKICMSMRSSMRPLRPEREWMLLLKKFIVCER